MGVATGQCMATARVDTLCLAALEDGRFASGSSSFDMHSVKIHTIEVRDIQGLLEGRFQEMDGFDGVWESVPENMIAGRIKGSTLRMGGDIPLQITSPTTFNMRMDGTQYFANLEEDGNLHWSDGDIWRRSNAGLMLQMDVGSSHSDAVRS